MRLIDADALKALIIRRRKEAKTLTGIDMVMVIDDAPTVDAVPVKHGRWIENEGFDDDCYYTCSVCQCDWTTIDGTPAENNMRYCPECGAKMDLEEEQKPCDGCERDCTMCGVRFEKED